ncbi:MAG: cytochrome C biogenesis protein [Bacteroidia bacterium]|nr:MAG: cytochrome C biogenesis protein [Bacteroidia bacterium]
MLDLQHLLGHILSWQLASPVTAALLGLLVAIDSCTLATSVTAIGYIAKGKLDRRNIFAYGLLYTAGRTVTYLSLALILVPILRAQATISPVQQLLGRYGPLIVGSLFILAGLVMLFGRFVKVSIPRLTTKAEKLAQRKMLGVFLLGMLFAMGICPAIGAIFFGLLLPLTATSPWGLWLPLIFAIATAIPVIVIAWLVAYSFASVGRFYQNMLRVQKWLNLVMALLFIIAGAQMLLELTHDHGHDHHHHHHEHHHHEDEHHHEHHHHDEDHDHEHHHSEVHRTHRPRFVATA